MTDQPPAARPLSLRRAALAGLIYAVLMSAWRYYDGYRDLDDLEIRFAIYFSIFTLGFWWLYNLVIKRRGADR